MTTLIGIKYVHPRPGPKRDCRAGTGLVWHDHEVVHYVTEGVAAKLLKHPDVWAEVDRRRAKKDEVVVAPALAETKQLEPELPPLVPLDTMSKADMIAYAQSHFGQKIPPQTSEENMRAKIRNLMNMPTATG